MIDVTYIYFYMIVFLYDRSQQGYTGHKWCNRKRGKAKKMVLCIKYMFALPVLLFGFL